MRFDNREGKGSYLTSPSQLKAVVSLLWSKKEPDQHLRRAGSLLAPAIWSGRTREFPTIVMMILNVRNQLATAEK